MGMSGFQEDLHAVGWLRTLSHITIYHPTSGMDAAHPLISSRQHPLCIQVHSETAGGAVLCIRVFRASVISDHHHL